MNKQTNKETKQSGNEALTRFSTSNTKATTDIYPELIPTSSYPQNLLL